MHPGVAYARKGAIGGAITGGLTAGALGAAVHGLPKKQHHAFGETETLTKKQRIRRAVVGGIGYGALGALHGGQIGWNHRARKWNAGGVSTPMASPDWLKGVKTKAEARKLYHAQARKLHPDLGGGNEDALRKLNQEWETMEPKFKTAMYAAFADELEKIASAGAILGGTAGWSMSPNTVKGKLMGVAGGALAGHMIGGVAGAAKRQFYDEPRAYERAQLYGYQPYAGQQQGSPTNFY